ncbi:MAG: ABC transporter permease [Peptococcaceae bacterium]|nr:ABC transporter permease [Candidatus Syntrophopropionicum ammoniitolerans]
MCILENKLAFAGMVIIAMLVILALFAPLLAPHDPYVQSLGQSLIGPCRDYPFGTDEFGRCVLSRIIYGTRISLVIGLGVTTMSTIIGVVLGMVAGFHNGRLDEIIMRVVDVFLAFPGLILALVVAGLLGPGTLNVVIALTVVGWMGYARVIRGAVLAEKEKEYIGAVQTFGAGDCYIMLRHLLPNVMTPIVVMASAGVGYVILAAAGLSFLGLGAEPPAPVWGAMLNYGKAYLQSAPHLTIFPGLAIMITVLAFNFLGDGLRDQLDPRMKNLHFR